MFRAKNLSVFRKFWQIQTIFKTSSKICLGDKLGGAPPRIPVATCLVRQEVNSAMHQLFALQAIYGLPGSAKVT